MGLVFCLLTNEIFPEREKGGNNNWSYQVWQKFLYNCCFQCFPFFLFCFVCIIFKSFILRVASISSLRWWFLLLYNCSKHCFLVKYSENCVYVCVFFCDSEQKSSYQCNNVGGFGDNFSLLFFKLLDRSMLLLSIFSIFALA